MTISTQALELLHLVVTVVECLSAASLSFSMPVQSGYCSCAGPSLGYNSPLTTRKSEQITITELNQATQGLAKVMHVLRCSDSLLLSQTSFLRQTTLQASHGI